MPSTPQHLNPSIPHVRALAEAGVRVIHARRSSAPTSVDDAGSIYGRLVPWDTVTEVRDEAGQNYLESFAPGGLQPPTEGVIPVYAGHRATPRGIERGPLVGRLDDVEARLDGLYGRVILADVPAANELRALARTVGATFSVEFTDPTPISAEVVRQGAELTGLAVLTAPARGAYADAVVTEVRAGPTDDEPELDADGNPVEADEDDELEGRTEGEGDAVEGGPPTAARAAIRREVARILGTGMRRVAPHPLARYRGTYEFYEAARASSSEELPHMFRDAYLAHRQRSAMARAFVDQVTTDNPGVMPPAWLTEIFGVIDRGRPVINAIGTRPLPPNGMEVEWPYFDGDLHALVGEQTLEKGDVTSVKVSFKKASTDIKTYAGGSDISWQLIRRSQPAYRDAYLRVLNLAYGVVTDNVVGDLLPAVPGHGTVTYDVGAADPDGAALKAAVFEASSKVQIATGSPASWVLAATDVFLAFGGMPFMVPATYGTQNVPGTATASTLNVNVSGLEVTHAPDLAPGTAIVSNGLACAWMEDGPFVVAADVVPKLGEDVAVWGMGAFAAFIPAGIILLDDGLPLAAGAPSTRKKAS
jgi:hypothetical protein